jgi:hypothetical protein
VVGRAILVHGPRLLVARRTTYLSTVAPPLLDGARQVSLTVALPGVAVGDRGAVGAFAARTMSCVALRVGPVPGAVDVVAEVVVGAIAAGVVVVVVDRAINSVVVVAITVDAFVIDVGALVVVVGSTVKSVDAGGVGLDVDELSVVVDVEVDAASSPPSAPGEEL